MVYAIVFLIILIMIIHDALVGRQEYFAMAKAKDTKMRQKLYRKWIVQSWLKYGAVSVVGFLALGHFAEITLPKLVLGEWVSRFALGVAIGSGVLVVGIVVSWIGSKKQSLKERKKIRQQIDEMAGGELIPRNSAERRMGGVLALSAGINEELFFRLFLPAVLIGLLGQDFTILAIVVSVMLFGFAHIYQGLKGVVSTGLLGGFFMLIYLATDSIVLVMILHTLIDLRSMVVVSRMAYD